MNVTLLSSNPTLTDKINALQSGVQARSTQLEKDREQKEFEFKRNVNFSMKYGL